MQNRPMPVLELTQSALAETPRDAEALLAVAHLKLAIGDGDFRKWTEQQDAGVPNCPDRDWAIGEPIIRFGV